MRLLLLGVVVALVGCGEPCRSSTSDLEGRSSTFRCLADDAGARVIPRLYSALEQNVAESCSGSLDGGALAFSLTIRSCSTTRVSGEEELTLCTLPVLPPGRYAVGDGALIVPEDGGASGCE